MLEVAAHARCDALAVGVPRHGRGAEAQVVVAQELRRGLGGGAQRRQGRIAKVRKSSRMACAGVSGRTARTSRFMISSMRRDMAIR